jgi:hypothetical protein
MRKTCAAKAWVLGRAGPWLLFLPTCPRHPHRRPRHEGLTGEVRAAKVIAEETGRVKAIAIVLTAGTPGIARIAVDAGRARLA